MPFEASYAGTMVQIGPEKRFYREREVRRMLAFALESKMRVPVEESSKLSRAKSSGISVPDPARCEPNVAALEDRYGGPRRSASRYSPCFLAPSFLAAVLLLLSSLSVHAQEISLQKIRVVCLNRPLPVLIAQTHGILARYGIDVEYVVVPNSGVLRDDLAGGKADVAFVAVDNDVAMVDSAGVDVVIVMGGESPVNELMAQPDIESIADLRGRTLLVDAPNTAFALQLKKVLLMNGLQSGKDYAIKPVGSTTFRLQALRENHDYAASILNPPFSILARHAGLKSFGSMRTLLGTDQDRGTFALRDWASGHADLLVRYLAGYIEGQRLLLNPSDKQEVVKLVVSESKLSESDAAEWYTAVIQAGAFAEDARFDPDGFKKNLMLRAEIEAGGSGKATAAEKCYDLSYYRAALSKIK
jgi:ABC-type nitrate/sulfonate/bicarbonate transport system substrate-binding protein